MTDERPIINPDVNAMARFITVEPVLFAFSLCVILSNPIQEELIYIKVCHSNYNSSICKIIKTDRLKYQQNVVQKEASRWAMYTSVCSLLPQVFTTLLLGAWSDKVGRKVVMFFPLVGITLSAVSMVVNSYYEKAPVYYILIGAAISALFGGFSALISSTFAYTVDITSGEDRTLRITILESMLYIGGAFGNLVGGILVQNYGYTVTYLLVVGVSVLTTFYAVCILQESYFPNSDSASVRSWQNCLVTESLRIFTKNRPNKRKSAIWILFVIFFFPYIATVSVASIYVLFAMHSPISASPSLIGYFLSSWLASEGIGMIVGMWILSTIFKITDYTLLILGTFSIMASLVFQGLETSTWSLFVAPVIHILGGFPIPIVRSLMSKNVEKNEQGALFSIIASFGAFTQLVGSFALTGIYTATVSWYPGFTFFVLAAVQFLPVSLAWYLQVRTENIIAYSTAHGGISQDRSDSINDLDYPEEHE